MDSAVMIPLDFPSVEAKRRAMTAAFIERFFLGFIVGPVAAGLDANGILIGVLVGMGTSVGTAIITRTWAPIIAVGLITGAGVGIAYEARVLIDNGPGPSELAIPTTARVRKPILDVPFSDGRLNVRYDAVFCDRRCAAVGSLDPRGVPDLIADTKTE